MESSSRTSTTGIGLTKPAVGVPAGSWAMMKAIDGSLTKLVTRGSLPWTLTTAPLTKLVPLTVKVNAVPPTIALVGEMLLSVGAGLLTVKSRALELPPPGTGLNTSTAETPAKVNSAAVICVVNCVAPMKLVA